MTRYFTALMTFMVVWLIVGIMFDGFDSNQGAAVTVIISVAAAGLVYLLYPSFTSREK